MSDLQTATVFHVDLIQVVYWKCNTDFIGFGMGHLAEKKVQIHDVLVVSYQKLYGSYVKHELI